MTTDIKHEKYVQAINYFARKDSNYSINRLKLIKLLWLADRLHLLRFGHITVDAKYCAMPHGPVASEVYNIAKNPTSDYAKNYLERQGLHVNSLQETNVSVFKKSELAAYDEIWKIFGQMDRYKLRDLSHLYPEWTRHGDYVVKNNTSVTIDMLDFFKMPEKKEEAKSEIFDMDEGKREYMKKKYEQGQALIQAMDSAHEAGRRSPRLRVTITPCH